MNQVKGVAAFRRTAISLAVGMCLTGVVYAQSADGNIQGTAKGGAVVTLTAPGGKESTMTARPSEVTAPGHDSFESALRAFVPRTNSRPIAASTNAEKV